MPKADVTLRSVLVVSGDPDLRDEMTYGFPEDVSISFADDAVGAVGVMQIQVPDLVVMSIRSGNAGGFSLALEMNQRVATQGVPMVLLLERAQDQWLAAQAGAVATLVAPFSSAQIVDSVLRALDKPSAA